MDIISFKPRKFSEPINNIFEVQCSNLEEQAMINILEKYTSTLENSILQRGNNIILSSTESCNLVTTNVERK